MTMQVFHILLVIAVASIANVAAQMISHRNLLRGQLVSSLIMGFGFGSVTLAAGLAISSQLRGALSNGVFWGHAAAAVLIYLSMSFTFLCLVAASETSVRFQILRKLRANPTGLTLAELDQIYSNRVLVRTRLNRLQDSGGTILVNNRYQLTSSPLLLIARVFRACKVLIYGVTNEFGLP